MLAGRQSLTTQPPGILARLPTVRAPRIAENKASSRVGQWLSEQMPRSHKTYDMASLAKQS